MEAVAIIQKHLESIPASVETALAIWGIEVPLEEFIEAPCACAQPDQCPGLKLTDLHHLCVDLKNASGNIHKSMATGLPWVEFHLDACFSVLAHGRDWSWVEHGIEPETVRALWETMSAQELAQSGQAQDGEMFRHHFYVTLSDKAVDAVTNPEKIAAFARFQNLDFSAAKERLREILAWHIGASICGRLTVCLNHEVVHKYRSLSSVRLWGDSFATFEQQVRRFKQNPWTRLPLMREGKVKLLETGSLPALREFAGRVPLPEPRLRLITEGHNGETN